MFTVIGGILLFNGASRFDSDEAIAADAPSDAPSDALMVGGEATLRIAARLGVRAARHPWI